MSQPLVCLFTYFVVGGGVLRLFSKGLIFAVTKPISGPRGLVSRILCHSLKSRAGEETSRTLVFVSDQL